MRYSITAYIAKEDEYVVYCVLSSGELYRISPYGSLKLSAPIIGSVKEQHREDVLARRKNYENMISKEIVIGGCLVRRDEKRNENVAVSGRIINIISEEIEANSEEEALNKIGQMILESNQYIQFQHQDSE